MSEQKHAMTALELLNLRLEMKQTPVTLAALLGVNVHTYYRWERTGAIPSGMVTCLNLLSQKELAPARKSTDRRITRNIKLKFMNGVRYGNLVIVGPAAPIGTSHHRHLKVRCECGVEKVVRSSVLLGMTKCGNNCEAKAFVEVATPGSTMSDLGDMPDLDAPQSEWSAYHVRKLHERAAALPPELPTRVEEDEEWEAGL